MSKFVNTSAKALTVPVVGLMLILCGPVVNAQSSEDTRITVRSSQDIRVTVNGRTIDFDTVGPREYNGRVLVPLRGVLESMAATVEWDSENQTVIATKGATTIQLPIGSRFARINNERVRLDVPAMTIAGTTMVPLRFLSESLGASVRWNPDTAVVRIETGMRGASNEDVEYRGENAYRRIRDRVVRLPEVQSVTTNLSRNVLREDEVITVTMRATPGGKAWFRIRGVVGELKMTEDDPGVYVGTWRCDQDGGCRINMNDVLAFVLIGDRASAEHHP